MLWKRIFVQSFTGAKLNRSQFKCLSTEAVEWDNAKPHASIPGPKSAFEFIRMMGPGGRYKDLPLDQLVASFRRDYGSIARFPGVLGQKDMIMTFLPEDIETILRTEGKFPERRSLESFVYFRKTLRPDLYPAGAGLTAT